MGIPTNAPQKERTRRLIGATFFILLFCASAVSTFAYFSEAPAAGAESQSAAVASTTPNPFEGLSLEAQAAYVKDLSTERVLYAKNALAPLPLASLTKIATALTVSEALSPTTVVTLPRNLYAANGGEFLRAGETWRVRDILNFMLVTSSNDAAEYLAAIADRSVHGRYPDSPTGGASIWRMNDLARSVASSKMYFLNASGLDESETQAGAYGSASDVAALLAYAASTSPDIFIGTTKGDVRLVSVEGAEVSARNTDEALNAIPGLVMGKTGYTDLAGGNLAVLFDIGLSHPVVAVVLGSSYEGRFEDIKRLVEASQRAIDTGR